MIINLVGNACSNVVACMVRILDAYRRYQDARCVKPASPIVLTFLNWQTVANSYRPKESEVASVIDQ